MTSLLSKEDNYTEIMDNVGVAALHVSPSTLNTTSISFGSFSTERISDEIPEDLSSNNTKVYFDDTMPKDVMSTITLPSALLDSIERGIARLWHMKYTILSIQLVTAALRFWTYCYTTLI